MKHFTCLAAVGCVIVAVIYWTNRRAEIVAVSPNETAVVSGPVLGHSVEPNRRVRVVEVNEPILVLPEIEFAPAPQPVAVAAEPTLPRETTSLVQMARPDRRDGRQWMPYAPEDHDLSATRKLEWGKLSSRDEAAASRPNGYEETEEPPLLNQDRVGY